jgi:hypothetical protein
MERLAEMGRLRRQAVRVEIRSRSEPVSMRMHTGAPLMFPWISKGLAILGRVAQIGLGSVNRLRSLERKVRFAGVILGDTGVNDSSTGIERGNTGVEDSSCFRGSDLRI